jgi:hypothetical protein
MTTRNELTAVNHRILGWIKRHRAVLLAIAFIAQILASPLADRDPHAGAILALILLATLVVGTSYQVNRKVAYPVLLPFCFLWLVARMLEASAVPVTSIPIWRRPPASASRVPLFSSSFTAFSL